MKTAKFYDKAGNIKSVSFSEKYGEIIVYGENYRLYTNLFLKRDNTLSLFNQTGYLGRLVY